MLFPALPCVGVPRGSETVLQLRELGQRRAAPDGAGLEQLSATAVVYG